MSTTSGTGTFDSRFGGTCTFTQVVAGGAATGAVSSFDPGSLPLVSPELGVGGCKGGVLAPSFDGLEVPSAGAVGGGGELAGTCVSSPVAGGVGVRTGASPSFRPSAELQARVAAIVMTKAEL